LKGNSLGGEPPTSKEGKYKGVSGTRTVPKKKGIPRKGRCGKKANQHGGPKKSQKVNSEREF